MASVNQRDGKLTPHQNQEMRWLVEGEWAFGYGISNMLELFHAEKSDMYKSGHQLKFKFTFANWDHMLELVPNLREYGSNAKSARLFDLLEEALKKHDQRYYLKQPVIPAGFTPEAQEEMNRRMGGSKRGKG